MEWGDVGVLVTTYNRVDDTRGAMEIIRGVWEADDRVGRSPILHVYNGMPDWWPGLYLEDKLLVIENERTHYRGAAALLDAGIYAFRDEFPRVRYAVVIAGDVWLYRPAWVAEVVDEMRSAGKRLATARWGIEPLTDRLFHSGAVQGLLPTDGLATDFFVLDVEWALRWGMFPLDYSNFLDAFGALLNYAQEMPFLERYFAGKYLSAVRAEMEAMGSRKDPWGSAGPRQANLLLRLMSERQIDPTGSQAPSHKGHWPSLGLITAEDVEIKRSVALERPELIGQTFDRLRVSGDTSWFNRASRPSTPPPD